MMQLGWWRRLFLCEGYLGLGPRSLDVEDEVWAVPKFESPMIFRRLSTGHHIVIGQAYVHGLTAAMVLQKAAGDEVQDVFPE